ncbi:MAG: tRNA (guanosine(37)-N1)-methyltransferase TrmD [Candidatus Babeliales bacterium]
MKISIVSLFPELYKPFLSTSLLERASDNKLVDIQITSLFSFSAAKVRVDGPAFGHGAGMVLKPEVIERAVEDTQKERGKAFKVFFSPHGTKLDQNVLATIKDKVQASDNHLMLIPARYEGIDARAEAEYADMIISIGDYVLMGGDVPAMVLLEGLLRLIPGVVGKQESVEYESFSGPFVDWPAYTAPVEWHGNIVPEVLRSGNHKAIEEWRTQEAAKRTMIGHFDWLRTQKLTDVQKKIAYKQIPSHYVALMHTDVRLPHDQVGTSSVTTYDIHDIARSSRTYDLKNYFIVTPLIDQQKIVQKLLDFWSSDIGIDYNPQRHGAVSRVKLVPELTDAIEAIEAQEGKKPLVIGTSARKQDAVGKQISFHDQGYVWSQDRPVLLLLGTAQGLSQEIIDRCDYVLSPIDGFSDFNHLSVRSAAAIIFDRWLGLNPK